ncbi:MAG: fructose-bisphosphatase class I, partial [Natronospirillum sp.]|nr:fructose-bisphosphatase class I [Natronospirillum sp.]
MSTNSLVTLGEFLVHQQKSDPQKARELSQLFGALRLTAKVLNRETNKAGLVDVIGSAGLEDPDNSQRQPLDEFANDKMKAALRARGQVAG